ncbi:MAG: hypothetical protein ACXWAT_11075 [Methylobacter sp.]
MKNKIIICVICIQIIGCGRYSGWERVSIEQSVHSKPCAFKNKEVCDDDECNDWFKKRATIYGANTIVLKNDKTTDNLSATYFYCAPGIPPFVVKPESAWFISNKFYPNATQLDSDKAIAECAYESHRATIDTSKPLQERMSFPIDPIYSIVKNRADKEDRLNQDKHRRDLENITSKLYEECLGAKGFISTHASDEASLAKFIKHCPDIDSQVTPCFIPAPK